MNLADSKNINALANQAHKSITDALRDARAEQDRNAAYYQNEFARYQAEVQRQRDEAALQQQKASDAIGRLLTQHVGRMTTPNHVYENDFNNIVEKILGNQGEKPVAKPMPGLKNLLDDAINDSATD